MKPRKLVQLGRAGAWAALLNGGHESAAGGALVGLIAPPTRHS